MKQPRWEWQFDWDLLVLALLLVTLIVAVKNTVALSGMVP